jgi:xylan 1,4-beta-xylosidase
VLNLFRMLGQMNGERVAAESTGALDLDDVLQSSVRSKPDVNAIATSTSHRVNVLVWNYDDNSAEAPGAEVHLRVRGLPQGVSQILLEHWRVDRDHSNAYTAWQAMGSPQSPSAVQYESLKAAGQLELLDSPRWVAVEGDAIDLTFSEPRQGVSLLDLTW